VSTATASDLTVPTIGGRHHFLLRRLHSLTGLVFGGYLIVHLLVNATLIQGVHPDDIYQFQVDKIHSLPFLWALEWGLIYLPIIYHTVYGIWITLTGQPNVGHYPYAKNIFYVLQRASAVVIVLFLIFHVLALKYGLFGTGLAFTPGRATETVARHLDHPILLWVVYPLGILASCYHLANGFWAAAITWGLTIREAAQRRWGVVCGVLGVLLFIAGIAALIGGGRAQAVPLTPDQAQQKVMEHH
jgi:succinate dehydrogenase / fumarate reductase cytochrome b subunit